MCSHFKNDVEQLLIYPSDLKELDFNKKVLILVEALNLVRHLLVRTFRFTQMNRFRKSLIQLIDSIRKLIEATGLDLKRLTRLSKRMLTQAYDN